ncbi:TPA: plasmid recombination protein [Escherichia coli]|nr:plasmid recombination protein [Escherichia coli]
MSYAILRTKKLKEWGNICASLEHNFRERLTPNADENRTAKNVHIGGNSTEEIRQKIEQGLPQKYRADCVKCIEYLITASPEFFKERSSETQQKYFDNAIEWLKERHGAENVKCVSIHNDESTPHLVAYVVPIDERGKLNAKKWLGGKKLLSEMQDDFNEKVGSISMLFRGVKGSKAKHQRVQRFYGELDETQRPKLSVDDLEPRVIREGFLGIGEKVETTQDIANRVGDKINALFDFKNAELHKMRKTIQSLNEDVESAKRNGYVRNYTLIQRNNALEKELAEHKENHALNTKGLSTAQLDALNAKIREFRAENEKERIEKAQKRSFDGIKI